MDLTEFKNKLDRREFWGVRSREMWDAAYKWQEIANEEADCMKWSWDCGLKLDYDGDVCTISSRFYPPHKSSAEYGKYHGNIKVFLGEECLHKKELEAQTLDELKSLAEEHAAEIIQKMNAALKSIF